MWARLLFERYACFRPLRRVAAWLSDQGLPISAGTPGDSTHRFTPLFEPVAGALLYRLNEEPLARYDPGAERQDAAFDAVQGKLKKALENLFAQARVELAALPAQAREGKALRSLLNHREGLRRTSLGTGG